MIQCSLNHGPTWIRGEVLTGGPRKYKIKLANGSVVRLHVDQMLNKSADSPTTSSTNDNFEDFQPLVENSSSSDTSSAETVSPESTSTLRRSTGIRNPPNRFTPVTN